MFFDEFPSQIDENACQNLLGAADMLTVGPLEIFGPKAPQWKLGSVFAPKSRNF